MRDKTRYTDEPMHVGRVLRDLLPPPGELVIEDESVKITISLSSRSVRFFKTEAAKTGGQYQRMIRSVLDAYVAVFDPDGKAGSPLTSNRLEEAGATYGSGGKLAAKRSVGRDKRTVNVGRQSKQLLRKDPRAK